MRQQGTCNITPYPHLQCRLQPPRHLVMDLWPLSFLRCMCMHVQRKRMKPTRSHVNNTKQTMQHSKRSHRSWHRREHRWSSAWCFERRVAESGLTCASAISCKSHYMCFHSICYIKGSIYTCMHKVRQTRPCSATFAAAALLLDIATKKRGRATKLLVWERFNATNLQKQGMKGNEVARGERKRCVKQRSC